MDQGSPGWVMNSETRRVLRLRRAEEELERRNWPQVVVELEELLDEQPSHGEALWRLAEALVELRDFETAREAASAYIDAEGPRPAICTLLAHCHFECSDFEAAAMAAGEALKGCEDLAEAHFVRGLALERLGHADAQQHLRMAHRMSPLTFPLGLPLTPEDWQLVLADVFDLLPPDLQEFWRPVPVKLQRFPTREELTTQLPPVSPRVAALYEGEPPRTLSGNDRPSALRIYTGNLERNDAPDAIIAQLAHALEQEAMDWLPPPPEP